MGINGLLPLLKSIQRPTELRALRGETLGVDAYGWLHRAAYGCALELATGKPTSAYVNAALRRVDTLQGLGVTPYMVFDGDFLPSKAGTEDSRAKRREEIKKKGYEFLEAGQRDKATQEFRKCIDVTPEMASTLIQRLKERKIPYVVAPYEADAQLVYLERHGHIGGIISDDSDLLVFGAKRLFTKMDDQGTCIEIRRCDFTKCTDLSLAGFTDANFRRMCILGGCDYLDNLYSIGVKTANRLLIQHKTPERIVQRTQWRGVSVPKNYLANFYNAELTFLHHWVFCPKQKCLVHLTDLDGSKSAEEMPFLGAHVEPRLARAVALGNVNPITKIPIQIPLSPSKRRLSQTAPKPIKSMFKGFNRIPMGEMDANCFAVDAQRVARISQGGSVARIFPLPRPYLPEEDQQRAQPTARAGPSPSGRQMPAQEALAEVNEPLPTHQARHPFRPPKKARLCGESREVKSSENSKFFPPSRLSPKRAKSEAYLLSDNSIEDVMSELPDFDGWKSSSKREKSIAIFRDESPKKGHESDAGTHSQKQRPLPVDAEGPDSQSSEAHVRPSLEKFKLSTFRSSETTASPVSRRSSRFRDSSTPLETPLRPSLDRFLSSSLGPSETPASSVSCRSSVFSSASTASTAPSTAKSRPTPLQRLGARATNSALSPRLPKPRRTGVAQAFGKGLPVNPAFVPLPKVDLKEVEALNGPHGSEDQIIPESDAEEDGSDDELEKPTTKLNLSRFAYV